MLLSLLEMRRRFVAKTACILLAKMIIADGLQAYMPYMIGAGAMTPNS
jgi:hypothetical protein